MKPRRNPAVSEHTLTLYRTLHAAVERGVRDILERGDGSAKCFQPLPATSRIGTVQQEMDLVRTCAGAWPRTGEPYEAAAPRMVDFLAFAYASERACRAAQETEAAEIWSFVRSIPKKATKAQNGYLQKGGVSRVLLSSRTMGEKKARCTEEMLAFEKPLDTLLFARSELWPVETLAGSDGWTTVDKRVRAVRPVNAAWRPTDQIETKDLLRGLLVAGASLSRYQSRSRLSPKHVDPDIELPGVNLDGVNLSWATIRRVNFRGASMRVTDLTAATIVACDLTGVDLYGASISSATLTASVFENANLQNANLRGVNMGNANFLRADLSGVRRSALDGYVRGWDARDVPGTAGLSKMLVLDR